MSAHTGRAEEPSNDLAGVYVGLERSLRATGEYAYATTEVVLLPDGSFRRNGLPSHGLGAGIDVDRARFGDMFWGRWRWHGDRVMASASTSTYVFTLSPDGLVDDDGRTWAKLPPMPPTPLDGVYARADFRDPGAPRVGFGGDGTFVEQGRFFAMVGSLLAFVQPDGSAPMSGAEADQVMSAGGGAYELCDYGLTLRYADGRVAQHACYVPPSGADRPDLAQLLVVGSAVLVRD